jgi:hypothetical protein
MCAQGLGYSPFDIESPFYPLVECDIKIAPCLGSAWTDWYWNIGFQSQSVHIEPSQDAHNAHTVRTHILIVILRPIPKMKYHIYI